MFIRTTGRRVVIVGGGEQAAQKARLMRKTDARLLLVAPSLGPELAALVAEGRAAHHAGAVAPDLFRGAAMTFVGTGCPGLDASLQALVVAAGCPVNVVDQPALCDLTTPSLVDRDPVVVAIGTEGTAPVLARQIRTRVEEMLAPNIGGLAAFAGRMRAAVAHRVDRDRRRAFWRWVFAEGPRHDWTRGAERAAAAAIRAAIATGGAPQDAPGGHVALVAAGPGPRDLLTLRAVARLQEADVIFHDRLADPGMLELARRDAERIPVGRVAGAAAWRPERIAAAVADEARRGRRVVRLGRADPGASARLARHLAAAAVGVPVEVVPGPVTAGTPAATPAGAVSRPRHGGGAVRAAHPGAPATAPPH